MADIWFTSDTHFNHKNILKFTDFEGNRVRSFDSVEEMNETMIGRWNSVVKPGDKVYHLGDVFFGPKNEFKSMWPRLNGSKRLVVGNHDDIKFLSSGGFFQKVMLWRIFKDFNFTCSHLPLDVSTLREGTTFNVHGHIHQNKSPSPEHICICVEQTNYTPVHLEELTAQMKSV